MDTLVFIVKKSAKQHPDYKLDNITPQFFVFKKGGHLGRDLHITLDIMTATTTDTMSTFTFTDKVQEGELCDLVFDQFLGMSDGQRVTIKGKLKSIPTKDLTDEQTVFLKCYDGFIAKIKAIKNTHGAGVAWSAHSPPPTTVVAPLSELVNLAQEINNITTITTTTTTTNNNNNSNVNNYFHRRGLDTTRSPGRGLPTSSRTSSPTRTTSSFAMSSSSSDAIARPPASARAPSPGLSPAT